MCIIQEQGPNMLPKPKEISNIELFIQQFLNMLWALLITATIFSLIGWFTDIKYEPLFDLDRFSATYLDYGLPSLWF